MMPGPSGPWGEALVEAVEQGRVPEEAVREKVRRLLVLALRVGALDGSYSRVPEPWPADRVAGELRSAAAAGFVLAANDGILPFHREQLTSLALIGPDAVDGRILGGGSATVFPAYTVGPLDGLRRVLGDDVEVTWSQGVASTDRVAPVPTSWLTGGALVRFLDASGAELGRETRYTGSLTWLGELTRTLRVRDVDTVELTAQVEVPADGTYLVGVAGVGPFVLTVDGATVLDATVALPEGADPVEGMMRPPQQVVPVELHAGTPVELVLRHRPAPTGGFGDADVATVTFKLLLAGTPVPDDDLLDAAAAAAAAADVAVVVVGTTEEVESEGFDRVTLALPGRQDELVRRVLAANPRTVVVVNSGAPVLLPWAEEAPAVLLTWFPGQEFGNALSDVLLGMREPGGRLPVTWPRTEDGLPSTTPVDGVLPYDEGLHIGYRFYDREGREPLYGFGPRPRVHHLGARRRLVHGHPGGGADGDGAGHLPRGAAGSAGGPGVRLPGAEHGRAGAALAGRLRAGGRGAGGDRDGHGAGTAPGAGALGRRAGGLAPGDGCVPAARRDLACRRGEHRRGLGRLRPARYGVARADLGAPPAVVRRRQGRPRPRGAGPRGVGLHGRALLGRAGRGADAGRLHEVAGAQRPGRRVDVRHDVPRAPGAPGLGGPGGAAAR
jgi:hypothetical protein